MAMPIRGISVVLEGAPARRLIREAKANEKKRGTQPISEEDKANFRAMIEKARRLGTLPL